MNATELLVLYERVADAPDAAKKMRQLVLELAVRGQLVEQSAFLAPEVNSSESGPRSVGITEEERFVDVPTQWSWKRISEIGSLAGGMTPTMGRAEYWDGDIVWLSPKDIKASEVSNSELKITAKGLSETRLKLFPPGSLFIVARSGILKRTLPVAINTVAATANQDLKVLVPFQGSLSRYLQIMLRGFERFILNRLVKTGTTVQSLRYDEFEYQAFPLPPLDEQHRIVAKVDELMALCDQLEAARTERESARDRLAAASLARLNAPDPDTFQSDARFALNVLPALSARPDQVKQLRQTILNLAVRGRLVSQDPRDEPAATLLEMIAEEQRELGARQPSRRDETTELQQRLQSLCERPANWVWGRVEQAVLYTEYGTSEKSNTTSDGVPVLAMGNIQNGKVSWGEEKRIPRSCQDLPRLLLKRFDLLYNRTNSAELVGKTGIYLGDDDTFTFASYLIRLRPSLRWTNPRYLNMAMNSTEFRLTQIVPHIKKQTGQANVNGTTLRQMLLPLPPLAEQHRIVAKVDELMAVCDLLEASLKAGEFTRSRILDAFLHEALQPAASAA
ncbi:restriction endonuclease subunit S [Gemmatimonas sp.]|uniref:restriction endonuclease subunit S n=1 Tax=Gemmatimonas sp. TaxID=1962908 RepID=UPI003341B1EE